MSIFPRTEVGGVSLPRLIIGTNWFMGYSHMSEAKDTMLRRVQTPEKIADIICAFLEYDIDAIIGAPNEKQEAAIKIAEDRTGRSITRILTPIFDVRAEDFVGEAARGMDEAKGMGATFCFPHQAVVDTMIDRLTNEIRRWPEIAGLIREREMIPGLSTHMHEAVGVADSSGADVESYVQIYNAAGFMMSLEVDWVMRIIEKAAKPVMTIKPLAAGKLLPPVGLTFAWNSIRDKDMVVIGAACPEEAHEDAQISLDLLARRTPQHQLQRTRSKLGLAESVE